jgi:hypothetical protein
MPKVNATQAKAEATQHAATLQSCGCPCDAGDCEKLSLSGFNFANLILIAQKDGPLAAAIIKDIIAVLGTGATPA